MMSDDMTPRPHWNPPAGAVTITAGPRGGFQVDCTVCEYQYPSEPYVACITDAREHKRLHRCPAGTPGAYPTCPVCYATGKHCRGGAEMTTIRGSQHHNGARWHLERRALYLASLME